MAVLVVGMVGGFLLLGAYSFFAGGRHGEPNEIRIVAFFYCLIGAAVLVGGGGYWLMSRASAEFESQYNRNDCFFWAHNRMVDGGAPRFLVNPNSAV